MDVLITHFSYFHSECKKGCFSECVNVSGCGEPTGCINNQIQKQCVEGPCDGKCDFLKTIEINKVGTYIDVEHF